MTFKELQDGTLFGRFKDAQRPYVKVWLNTRYARIWTAFEWSFRIVEPTSAQTVAGNRYLSMPPQFSEVRSLYDDNADELPQLDEAAFNRSYLYGRIKGLTGKPEAFTVVDRKIILGPVPDAIYAYQLGYKRILCHFDDFFNAITAGPMVADQDKPVWPDEHHEVLIVGAQALGLKLVNDPAWFSLEQQHDDLIAGMVSDGLLHDTLARNRQYGADPL